MHDPDTTTLSQQADVAMERGDFPKAFGLYQQVLVRRPREIAPLMNAGMCQMAVGKFGEARAYFEKAIELNDQLSHAYHNVGLSYAYQFDHEQAIVFFDRTIKLDKTFLEAYLDAAQSCQDMGQHERALTYFIKARRLDPKNIHVHNMMGISYTELGAHNKSLSSYAKALNLSKGTGPVLANAVKSCYLAHDWDSLDNYMPKLEALTERELNRDIPVSKTPFTSLLSSQNLTQVRNHTASFLRRYQLDVHIAPDWKTRLSNKKPLKIGYLSSDFRNQVIAHLTYKLFALHDRSRFHVSAISSHPGDDSVYCSTIKETVDTYLQLKPSSSVLKDMRSLELDVLIDMNGLHDPHMLSVLAQRVAPLQMLYLGWAGTSATNIYDYIVTDKYLTPPDHQFGYSETFLPLDRCYQVASYDPLPKKLPERKTYGLPKDAIVYCSFFSSYKLTRAHFETWISILKRVPKSVLWVRHTYDDSSKRLKSYLEKAGVDPNRLIFATFVPMTEHMSRLRLADIALDTWPYNGGATTSNALYAGVPVIAIQGTHYTSRMSTSMLTYLEMTELVTKNPKKYVDLAVKMGTDQKALMTLKKRLATRLKASRIFDTSDFVTHFEKALVELIDA